MKPTKFFFLVCIFFALVEVSVLEEKEENSTYIIDFICLGLENYKANETNITFKALFMNLNNKEMINSFRIKSNITYLTRSSDQNSFTTELRNGECTIENTKLNDDYIYYNCIISIDNISNIKHISISGGGDYFGGEVVPGYYLLEKNNLMEFTKELYIFNLTEEIEEKHGQFILKGKMHKNLTDNEEFKIAYNDMNGTLDCQKKSGLFYECKLLPTSLIKNRTIEQRSADSSKSKIIVVARFLKNIYIEYPKNTTIDNPNEKNVTIISVGNFNHNNILEDAIGIIYLLCDDYPLNYLKEFIRFYVDINYNPSSNLRMLQNKEKIEVIGKKNLSEIYKHIVSYDLTYMNTSNKTISDISSPCNISFSDNGSFIGEEDNEMNIDFTKNEKYEFLEKEEKKYEIMTFNKNNTGNSDANTTSNSFSFGFDTLDDILNIEKYADVNLSYKPDNEERYFDKCNLEYKGYQSYSIKCSPKRDVHALMNTLRIDITHLLKKRRLTSVSVRILQDAANTILIPDQNSPGIIDYQYKPSINNSYPKKNSSGLSGGAIAAIIIASIITILLVVFLIFFINRSNGPVKPLDKSKDIVQNSSSSNINN